MKQVFIFLLFSIFLLGCSKENKTNKLLKGEWEVHRTDTFWSNSNSNPSFSQQDNYATVEFDKKGKGTMNIPAGVYYSNGFEYPYEAETYELEAGVETVLFKFEPGQYATDSETFKLSWKWDKKTFVLFKGGMEYNGNASYYVETKFTCKKK